MRLGEYYKINEYSKKYIFFYEFTSSLDYSIITLDEIWDLLNISFTLFRHCFEHNKYENSEYVSNECEKMLDYYLSKCDWENMCTCNEKVDFILDIICFVYELTYKYEQKAEILRRILNAENVDKSLRQRAMEEVKSMVPFSDLFTEEDINSFKESCN